MDNREKVNIVRRALLGIDVVGVDQVLIMPDPYGIGHFAMDRLQTKASVGLLDMEIFSTPNDSRRAAAKLCELGADCLIVLGGDGTNRMVAQVCGDVPLLPISTGTNNVWPQATEGTVAGLAAAAVARQLVPLDAVAERTNQLDIAITNQQGDTRHDIALVDAAAYDGNITGSRAVWKTEHIRELVLSNVQTGTLGLSSIGAAFAIADKASPGLYVSMGDGPTTVQAPIAPGMVKEINIASHQRIGISESVELTTSPCVIAVDGERETVIRKDERVTITLTNAGPYRIDVQKTMRVAAEHGLFISEAPSGASN